MKSLIVRLVGIAIFVVAFFLPAVRGAETGPGSGPYIGWTCAVVAISASAGIPHLFAAGAMHDKETLGALCLILSGWINPLVGLYLLFCIWKRLVIVRRVMGVAMLACMVATWVFFSKAPMYPLIGHFLWIGGILIVLSPEVASLFGRPQPEIAKTPKASV
jgi:hypothetical protein